MEKPEFGTKLIEVRKAKGLTQEEVAEKCNVTVRTIQRIESGVVKPRAFTIKTISTALGFDFFDNSDTGYDVIVNQNTELEKHTVLWYAKDLFNLKTNAMTKISILSVTVVMIVLSLFTFSSTLMAQKSDKKKNSITIERNADKSIKRIEVRFTNVLTYDSLIVIKNIVEQNDIKMDYKTIEFDDNNRLKAISCKVFTDNSGGSFYQLLTDSTSVGGFFRDYSKNAKTKFCIGGGCFKRE
jgi:transcriptional regulator with XRE-family HTH domain